MTEESHSGSWSVENSYNNITKEDLKHIVTPQQYLHFIRTDATNAKVQRRVQIREIPAVQFTGYDDLGSDEF
ncbi:hypothetical protein SS50377_26684 [Spironucleus salmonicida]|uniref:Uncharacterized protein n=1 Tax=Spironucleus salmonicida TaxID=348837 RepID=V6M6X9_9EUKA|nr:hypothetical protein SS50377_26684 [Spironucleus salmonicida]|eukprot:EST49159.1 Hypothetical protein SS50377_10372 [Spironucleus salmonicida]